MLPRDDVHVVYRAIRNATTPTTREDLYKLLRQYTIPQINWAVGTLVVQGIFKVNPHVRSDRVQTNPSLKAHLPFDGYVGWEEAK